VYFVPLFLAISHILKKNKKKNTKKDKKTTVFDQNGGFSG
jgi:hypothetical protein